MEMITPSIASDISTQKDIRKMHATAPLLSPGSKLSSAGVFHGTGKPKSAKSIKATSHSMITGLTKATPMNVGPQDGTWVRRAEQDETFEQERISSSSDLRKHHLTRQSEAKNQKKLLRQREAGKFEARQKALKAEAKKEKERAKMIRNQVLEAIDKEVLHVKDIEAKAEADNIEFTHKTMAEVFNRVYSDESDAAKEARHQLDQAAMWAYARNEEHKQDDAVADRIKHEHEHEQMEMRALKKALDEKADKRRAEFCRRAKHEMHAETVKEHDREDTKAKDRFNKSVEGRRANLHYDATHGDRLHWSAPPTTFQVDGNGDGTLTKEEVLKSLTATASGKS
eukprot:CAMPEP_0174714058 /NCGR_PEP_ID=MMETSP1094-20130205/16266_1 /TAXON_ID=156173 /ORGANISM="Chrysochromulina brevifilum, Strain UTEX LB 985" /LENGTH=339 /DNA_ID=CAMNT_0015913325 /DNA_START=41 /DNA_END=1060 /DNA_ORIENTATION=-